MKKKVIGYSALVILLVALDQIVKYLVRANIELGGSVKFLPGIMDLTYVQNTGMAFSLLSEYTWVLTLVSGASIAFFLYLLIRRHITYPLGVFSILVVLAGAIGNLIDRVAFGFVTDMFRTLFLDFPVFNIADICIVLGGIVLCGYYLFSYNKYEKKGASTDENPLSDG